MDRSVFLVILPYWLKAFAITLALEVPLYVLVSRRFVQKDRKVSTLRLALAGAAGTFLTHPLLWFVWPRVVHDYTAYIISGELIVAVVESFVFYLASRAVSLRAAFITSFVANAVSFALGALIQFVMY